MMLGDELTEEDKMFCKMAGWQFPSSLHIGPATRDMASAVAIAIMHEDEVIGDENDTGRPVRIVVSLDVAEAFLKEQWRIKSKALPDLPMYESGCGEQEPTT